MGNLHPATAAEMIKELKNLIVTPELEQKNQLQIKDMVMAQKVVQHILYDQKSRSISWRSWLLITP